MPRARKGPPPRRTFNSRPFQCQKCPSNVRPATDRSVPGNVVGGGAARAAAAAVAARARAAEQDVALRVLRGDLVVLAAVARASVTLLMLLELLLKGGSDHSARRVGGPRADAEDAGRTQVLLRAGAPHQTVVALKRTNVIYINEICITYWFPFHLFIVLPPLLDLLHIGQPPPPEMRT